MKLKHLVIIAMSAAVLAAAPFSRAAELGDASKLPPPSKETGLTFEKHIKPLFEKSCLGCHGENRPKSKYRVDSREAVIKGGSSGDPAVVPGQSAKSILVHYCADLVKEMEMPPVEKREKYPALTKQQIGILRAWIDQGAK